MTVTWLPYGCASPVLSCWRADYSGWFDPELAAQFGVVSIDWANNENSWRSKSLPYPDQADLVTQAKMIKAASMNRTKVFVYRQGQGAGSPAGKQATELLTNPIYDGFFLKSIGAHAAGDRAKGSAAQRRRGLSAARGRPRRGRPHFA